MTVKKKGRLIGRTHSVFWHPANKSDSLHHRDPRFAASQSVAVNCLNKPELKHFPEKHQAPK